MPNFRRAKSEDISSYLKQLRLMKHGHIFSLTLYATDLPSMNSIRWLVSITVQTVLHCWLSCLTVKLYSQQIMCHAILNVFILQLTAYLKYVLVHDYSEYICTLYSSVGCVFACLSKHEYMYGSGHAEKVPVICNNFLHIDVFFTSEFFFLICMLGTLSYFFLDCMSDYDVSVSSGAARARTTGPGAGEGDGGGGWWWVPLNTVRLDTDRGNFSSLNIVSGLSTISLLFCGSLFGVSSS